jgi:uncharacterized membrane protein YfcA
VLVALPQAPLKAALALFAIAVGVQSIFNPTPRGRISKYWCVPVGILGGSIAAVFGAGGPLYIAYLSGRLSDKSEIRSTISAIITVSATTRALVYAFTGLLLTVPIAVGMAILSPFVWGGLKLGSRIHTGLTQEQMRRAIGAILILTGAILLARTLL